MSEVLHYLDCGCAMMRDGSRSWCPTCAGGGIKSAPSVPDLLSLLRDARAAIFFMDEMDACTELLARIDAALKEKDDWDPGLCADLPEEKEAGE